MTSYKIAAWESPPLVSNTSGVFGGVLPDLAHRLVERCTHNSSVALWRSARSFDELHDQNEGVEHFVMPYAKAHSYEIIDDGSVFLPVAVSPCAYYFVDGDQASIPIWELLAITWELLIIMIVSCGYAGLVIWVFDRSKNKDQFPLSFSHGFWEGVWWSFVTMTTVGYGDRYPKSIPGRVFAMLWILVGIVIISVFTAGLTTALSSEDSGKKIISGKIIAVLEGSEEHSTAIAMGATTIGYPDLETLTKQVKKHSQGQSGFIVDSLHALHLADQITKGHFKVLEKLDRTIVYGILIQGMEADISRCMRRFMLQKKYQLHKLLKEGEKDIPDAVYFHGQDTLYMLLHSNELIVIIYASVLVTLLMLAFIWHLLYWLPRHAKSGGLCAKLTACVTPDCECGKLPETEKDKAIQSLKDKESFTVAVTP